MAPILATPPMPSVPTPTLPRKTIAELLHELGDIPADRVRLHPYPGTATEADVIFATETECLCELIDGTLVEKPMGTPEAYTASLLIQFIGPFVRQLKLGMVTGADGMYRMIHGNIREPDVSFTALNRVDLSTQVSNWCPDLCVEVLSPSNTRAEMARKRAEYFGAGCRLVWEIDPFSRTAEVFTDAATSQAISSDGTLDGGDVLPGFTLSLAELWAELDEMYPPTTP